MTTALMFLVDFSANDLYLGGQACQGGVHDSRQWGESSPGLGSHGVEYSQFAARAGRRGPSNDGWYSASWIKQYLCLHRHTSCPASLMGANLLIDGNSLKFNITSEKLLFQFL